MYCMYMCDDRPDAHPSPRVHLISIYHLTCYLPRRISAPVGRSVTTNIQMPSHFYVCMYVRTYPTACKPLRKAWGVYVQSLFETHVHPLRYEVRTYIHEASVHEMCKGCGDAHRLRANRVLRFPPRLIAEGCVYGCTYVHACTL